jgi:MGT family glycosyltransferase
MLLEVNCVSKIVFFGIPAYGHTNPTLGVVKELVSMGNVVYYYSFQEFKNNIENAGAHFISCDCYDLGMDLGKDDTAAAERVGKDILFSTELIAKATLAMDKQLTMDMQRVSPDVIVGDSVAYWGKLVAMKLKIPFVSSTTTFAFNSKSSSIMKITFREMIKMLLDLPKTRKILAPLRDKGYPVDNILSIIQNDNETNTIVYTSKKFQPCAETFSDKYNFVGPSLRAAEEVIDKTKEKLVYISLGTVNNKYPSFYKDCLYALSDSRYQVIISVGSRTDISEFEGHSDNVSIFPKVDQIAVLQKADVFLTHCGMNSANESLYFGVPMVLFPQTTEQGGVARRIEQVGAGRYLKKHTASGIKEAIENVLSDASYKKNAVKISESFASCGGAQEAAKAIVNANSSHELRS